MKFRGKHLASPVISSSAPAPKRFSLKVALWLLDSPRLGDKQQVKHLAGRLLKQPARQGVVEAQSRLGQMLCRDCGNARDRRIGHDLLRQAARAGDRLAQLEYARLCQASEPELARYWLELAAGQGSQEARRLLRQLAQA
ncbi:tetratricopeptide repeat protein [Pseudomonas sp. NPDC089396]|uniref:tetratricopeptide repeat protein n=1 Tax=Pseudomonas sp. NPDC089396 TaxID=3364461 RepID=UPI0038357F03